MSDDMQGMRVELRKGDRSTLKGKLIAYVRILGGPPADPASPFSAMVRNGILAVQANYVDQKNIRDFFREEFGISLEKGIQEVIDQAKDSGGLEGALDPEAVKERLESMKNADFIPIPAKIAHFDSESELLAQDADIYFLGSFTVLSHAHLCVNSFPIMYQAYFREQEHNALEQEINALLGGVERGAAREGADKAEAAEARATIHTYTGDIKALLLKDLIPKMIYSRGDRREYQKALDDFKAFMGDFGYPEDMQAIISLVESNLAPHSGQLLKLELLVAKIEALQREDYEALERIKRQLAAM